MFSVFSSLKVESTGVGGQRTERNHCSRRAPSDGLDRPTVPAVIQNRCGSPLYTRGHTGSQLKLRGSSSCRPRQKAFGQLYRGDFFFIVLVFFRVYHFMQSS